LAALGAIWWSVRGLSGLSARGLLSGVTEPPRRASEQRRGEGRAWRRALVLAALSIVATGAVVLKIIPEREAFAGFSWPTIVFFLVGLIALSAGLFYFWGWGVSGLRAADP